METSTLPMFYTLRVDPHPIMELKVLQREKIKYLSLFSGIGGFELGIGDKAECVGYSEIDKYAIEIYQKHFSHKNYGDITKIQPSILPSFDLLVGGFPCQSFSIAGKRGGFNDTRGTLFFDIARIIKEKQPRLLLLENVKGLLSHAEGKTFYTIISTLDELGYDIQWQVLNSKNHGVPQNRERVFIVGHLRGTRRPEVFPLGEGDSRADETRNKKKQVLAHTLRAKLGGPDLENSYLIQKSPDFRKDGSLREFEKYSPTIRSNMGDNHPMVIQRGRGKNKGGKHSVAPTLTGKSYQDNNLLNNIRRLTPTECERLQGFPDGWTAGISDTQRYKCLGNAVTVNVIRDVVNKML